MKVNVKKNLCLGLLFFMLAHALGQDWRFKKLVLKDGQSVGNVLSILQDKKGYIWFGTEDGLKKYDGSKLTAYRHNRLDSTSISDDYISSIVEDKNNNLWIGTSKGLNSYDPSTDLFKQYYFNFNDSTFRSYDDIIFLNYDSKGLIWVITYNGVIIFDPISRIYKKTTIYSEIPGKPITDIHYIYEAKNGDQYIGTRTNGLYVYSERNKKTTHYCNDPENPHSLINNFVNYVVEDKENTMWIGTMAGLELFDRQKNEFISYFNRNDQVNNASNNHIRCISVTNDNNLWLCTNDGLNYGEWNSKTRQMKYHTFSNKPGDGTSISSNSLTYSIIDTDGRLWIGSRFGGINIYDSKQKNFENFRLNINNQNSLSHNNVSCFAEDQCGNIWIATDGGGLNKYDKVKKQFTHYKNVPNKSTSIKDNKILALLVDNENKLWIGYWGAGLDCYDINKNKFEHYNYDKNNSSSLPNNYIYYLYEDREGNIWICFWRGGFAKLNKKTKSFIRYPEFQREGTDFANITSCVVYEDKKGIIWIGTQNNGLMAFDKKTEKIEQYSSTCRNGNCISDDYVTSIIEDSRGILWIGTMGGGLNTYNRETKTFTNYTSINGLCDNAVCGILEDNWGNLWISTHKGLSKISVKEEKNTLILKFRNYNMDDGLPNDQFNMWAYFKDKSGLLYFGGTNGYTAFRAENILDNKLAPKVLITDFYIFNKRIKSENDEVSIKKSIDGLKQITLSYKQNMVTFEFTSLNYTDPYKNQFAYKLEGFEDKWNESGNYNRAVYTNLDPGVYTFRVKASNNDGYWNNEGVSLKLIIKPPFWQTTLFRIVVGGLIIFLVYNFFRKREDKLRVELTQQREYETVLKLAKNKAEESDKLKSSILANISHEIRTPLNAIIGFSDLLVRQGIADDKKQRYSEIIKSRCNDLIFTVESVLNVSTIVTGSTKIIESLAPIDIIVDEIFQKIERKITELGKDLKVKLDFTPEQSQLNIKTDVGKLKTILWHLLDNAVKFSEIGEIKIGFDVLEGMLKFYVSDEGIGIEKSKKEIIFEQFRQYDMGLNRRYGGMGLGLSLCKGFLDILGGEIWFESSEGKGTTFYFTYPVKFSHNSENLNQHKV